MRAIMTMENFEPSLVSRFRVHSGKVTVTSAAMHTGEKKRAVNIQGAWQHDDRTQMQMVYLRQELVMAMQLQERVISRMSSGMGFDKIEDRQGAVV